MQRFQRIRDRLIRRAIRLLSAVIAALYRAAASSGDQRREAKWRAECESVGMRLVVGQCRSPVQPCQEQTP